MKKISIIYRAYPKISKKTFLNFESKNELIDFAIDSLVKSLYKIDFEFIFLNDNCTDYQVRAIESKLKPIASNFKKIELNGVGNEVSFLRQLREAINAKYENILLLEDDYFIDVSDIALNIEAIESKFIDYSTFYYHTDSDFFNAGMRIRNEEIKDKYGYPIILLPSTTLTFFTSKNTLKEDIEYFKKFNLGASDCAIWLKITANFKFFLSRARFPFFLKNKKLFLWVIYNYIKFLFAMPTLHRKLGFIGFGKTSHLDSFGVDNYFQRYSFISTKFIEFKNEN